MSPTPQPRRPEQPTARLDPAVYRAAIARESDRFAAVLAEVPAGITVPTCPDWDAEDLLWHLTRVQWFWSEVVTGRPAAPAEDGAEPERPLERAGLAAAFDRASRALRDALAVADPAETAWSWADEQTVGFTLRRQAHEALVHRIDAELTAGRGVGPIDPALAADGVAEALEVMYGGDPGGLDGVVFRPAGGVVRVWCDDVDVSTWVRPGRLDGALPDGRDVSGPHLVAASPVPSPAVVVRGPAAALDRWLWHRGDDAALTVESTDAVVEAVFRSAVAPGIE